ncbi:MAG: sulfatase [Gemmatales bacterium]|nr:MAG: sulfatase [Gemmatales bacterium]
MNQEQNLLLQTRRHFFQECAVGLGAIALTSLFNGGKLRGASSPLINPLAPKPTHFAPKAKHVIYLFMAGGPSQLETFEYKPELQKLHGQPIPESFIKGKRFAFMASFTKERPKLLGTKRKFGRYGERGTYVSEVFPHIASIVDDIAIVRSMQTNVFNHGPAKVFMNTGSPQFGRPSMGAWLTYGIGSEASDLPGFVVLQSGPRGPRGGAACWASGFLPSTYQGVPFRTTGEPILNLTNPKGITSRRQRQALDTLRELNTVRLADTGDPEIATRISSYEMAYRMQTSAPELIDISREDKKTLELYGAKPGHVSFANNCLLARRLVERGVRFVQLYHTDWDHHGSGGIDLDGGLDKVAKEVDQPAAALVKDLKSRGLLDETLVIWGGEFGRTPMGEIRAKVGRNHHIDAFTVWLAGGGIKPGIDLGVTDEFGFAAVEDKVHVHDLHATILHLLGLDHEKLTFRFQGRDFRLTDVHGKVVEKLLA